LIDRSQIPDSRQYETFEAWLNVTITAAGVTPARLATRIGVPPATVYRWLGRKSGEKFSFLSPAMAQRLHDSLGVSLEELERLKPSVAARAASHQQTGATNRARHGEVLKERGHALSRRRLQETSLEQRAAWGGTGGRASAESARARARDPEEHRRAMEARWSNRGPLGALIIDAAVQEGLTVKDWALRHDLTSTIYRILSKPGTAVMPYTLELLVVPLGKSVEDLEALTHNAELLSANGLRAARGKEATHGADYYRRLSKVGHRAYMKRYDRAARSARAGNSLAIRKAKQTGQKRSPESIERMREAQRSLVRKRSALKAQREEAARAAGEKRTQKAHERYAKDWEVLESEGGASETQMVNRFGHKRKSVRDWRNLVDTHTDAIGGDPPGDLT
jgi:plasmid maintenance system antidote protein VapI